MMLNENQSMVKTFLRYSIPCILGLFLTSSITIIDGMFIAWKMGERGLAAVNLTLPLLYILLAFTVMIGAGGVTLTAQSLGRRNQTEVNHYFTLSLVITGLINIAIFLILALFQEQVLALLNARGVLKGLVRDYLGTMKFFYLLMMLNLSFSVFIRGEGKPQLSLLFGVIANILNVILDYLFIFRFNGGMKGAALASGISVTLAFAMGIIYFLSKRSAYKFSKITINPADLRRIVFLGSSEFVAQISASIITYIFNWILLKRIGIQGLAAITIVGYVSFVQNMILTGIAVGIHPVLSYLYGEGNSKGILNLTKIALISVIGIGVVTCLMGFFGGRGIAGIFTKGNGPLLTMASFGLKIFSLSFILNGYNIIAAAYFTSMGDALRAAVISILRSLVLLVILVLTLPVLVGNVGIWLAPPVTEVMVFGIAYYWVSQSKRGLEYERVKSEG